MKSIIVAICIAALLCGCTGRKEESAYRTQSSANIRSGTTRVYKRLGDYQQDDGLTIRRLDNTNVSTTQRAKSISEALGNMEGIKEASVVITGNIAIVGIETTTALSGTDLIKCRNEVEKNVKATDREIDHVTVTTTPELVNRVKNLAGSEESSDQPA